MTEFIFSENTLSIIDKFVKKFASKLDIDIEKRRDFEEEIKSNIKSSIEDLMSNGQSEQEALDTAIQRFGDLKSLENEIEKLNKKVNRMSYLLKVLITAIMVCLTVLIIGMLLNRNSYVVIPIIISLIIGFAVRHSKTKIF